MKTALKNAWLDPVVKEHFFTTPLAMQSSVRGGARRSHDEMNSGNKAPPKKNNAKGGGKSGKGKGKGKASKNERASETLLPLIKG